MIEIGLHPLRAADEKLHEGGGLLQQSAWCSAAIGAAQLRLEVPVEILVRVALRCVGWQVEHLDFVLMCLYPRGDLLRMVCPEVVENEEDLVAFAVLHESLHEAKGRLGSRCTFKEFESHQALAADGRDHRQTKTLAGGGQHRRMARRGIASDPVTVLRHRRLVGPVDDAIFLLGLTGDQRGDLLHPALHIPGLLLQGAAGGTLGRVAPAFQVFAYRADRHVDAKLHLDEAVHGPTIPQGKRQASCRGRLRGQDRAQHPFLRQRQGATRQVGASTFAGYQTIIALSRVALGPAEHGGGVQAHDPRDLAPGQPQLLAQAHGLAAQSLERIRGKLSRVDLVHGQ